jgi:hypothetical protein
MSKFLDKRLKKIRKKYETQFVELEKCFVQSDSISFEVDFEKLEASFDQKNSDPVGVQEYSVITLAAHYVVLVSFLEALFDEVIEWLVEAYDREGECLDLTSKIKPFITWEYGHNSKDDKTKWKKKFRDLFKPTSTQKEKVLHRLGLVLDLKFITILEQVFDDLLKKRHKVAHGVIYRVSIMDVNLKKEYNLKDLKAQEKHIKIIMNDLLDSCERLIKTNNNKTTPQA